MATSLGEYGRPESYRARFDWARDDEDDDDAKKKHQEPKVGTFRRQMRRHRTSKCCKLIVALALSMSLTQMFFYYTGTSVSTFNYKRTMPMAMFFETLGYDYGEADYRTGDTDTDDYNYLLEEGEEEDAVGGLVEDGDTEYDAVMSEAKADLEDESMTILKYDHLDPESENYADKDKVDHIEIGFEPVELKLDIPKEERDPEPIVFVPKEHPIPPAPSPPAHALPTQEKESELINMVFSQNKEEADQEIETATESVEFQPVPHFPTLPDDHNKRANLESTDAPDLDEPQEYAAVEQQPQGVPDSQAMLNQFLDNINEQRKVPDEKLSDEQLLKILTKSPQVANADTHFQHVLDKYQQEQSVQQQPPSDQKPTLIDLEPDIEWDTKETEAKQPSYPDQALAALVKNQGNPTEQSKILSELMEWQMKQKQESSPVEQAQQEIQTADRDAPLDDQLTDNEGELQAAVEGPGPQQLEVIPTDLQPIKVGSEFLYGYFPDGFMWSVATAAFQIEGGWNEGGKGKSIWDVFSHDGHIEDGSNAHLACDSYHRYLDDVRILKELGVKTYRFSIAWTRILPTGSEIVPNKYGVAYYNKLIDALLEAGIEPVVTLYHWDLPQGLQDQGGWLNKTLMIKAFTYYSKICFTEFGDRVKFWITINEPSMVAWVGYGRGKKAPGIHGESDLVYLAGHTLILAHSSVYRLYQSHFQHKQKGFVGISLNIVWKQPKTLDPADIKATERAMQFDLGWFAEPIYGSGDYPEIMRQQVARKSMENGLPRSRLPEFTPEEIQGNKGTSDFFGLNTYTTRLVEHFPQPNRKPTYFKDQDVKYSMDPAWEMGSRGRAVYPEGLRKLLNWIQHHYGGRPIFITENGISDDSGAKNDTHRITYLRGYINNVLKAVVVDGVKVIGYTVWSLMDNFEWERGYQEKLGLYNVDFTDPDRPRTPKDSAKFYAQLIRDNGFPPPS